jgi:hypothetical protein
LNSGFMSINSAENGFPSLQHRRNIIFLGLHYIDCGIIAF